MDQLTHQDLQSQAWRKVAAIMGQRRLEHLEQLAAPGLGQIDSELLRGRIAEIDSMLSLSRRASGGSGSPPSLAAEILGLDEQVSDISKGLAP